MNFKMLSIGIATALISNVTAHAEALPNECKGVTMPNLMRVVVPTAPGNSSDTAARTIFGSANKKYGISFVVENKPGASGNIGMMGAKDLSQKDPNSLIVFAQAPEITLNPFLTEPKPMHTHTDFKALTYAGGMNYVLICYTSDKLPRESLTDLDSFLKHITEKKISVDMGDGGVTNTTGLLTMKLGQAAGISVGSEKNSLLRPIPYKSTSDAMRDVMGGQVDCMFQSTSGADGILKTQQDPNQKVRAVTIASANDSKEYNLLAAKNSLRARGFGELKNWMGLFVSPKMDVRISECLDSITKSAMNDPATVASLTSRGLFKTSSDPATSAEFATFVQSETQKMKPWSAAINKLVTGK